MTMVTGLNVAIHRIGHTVRFTVTAAKSNLQHSLL